MSVPSRIFSVLRTTEESLKDVRQVRDTWLNDG